MKLAGKSLTGRYSKKCREPRIPDPGEIPDPGKHLAVGGRGQTTPLPRHTVSQNRRKQTAGWSQKWQEPSEKGPEAHGRGAAGGLCLGVAGATREGVRAVVRTH